MQLESLSVLQFRNIEQAELHPDDALTVICGNNGQGKTNLLEAIWLLTGGKSFRNSKDVELIQKGKQFSVLDAITKNENYETNLKITIGSPSSEKAGRNALKNGVDVGRATCLAGHFTATIFAPVHLNLIKGGPDGRRRFLDAALCQLYSGYLTIYRRYARALAQKNAFLRTYFQNHATDLEKQSLLDVYDQELAKQGEEIQKRRLAYLQLLSPFAIATYSEISSNTETLSIRYLHSFEPGEFFKKLQAKRDREIVAGCCLFGVHREDFEILLNGDVAKVYASQGQQRSAVLSLKLAEAAVANEITGNHPVMLLDDVLSELDDHRQQYLLTRMSGKQSFITSCDGSSFAKTNGKIVIMEKGILKEL